MTTPKAVFPRVLLTFILALAASLLLFSSGTAAAAAPIAADGKIHACYKFKGKGKGTLRVVRNDKVRCPKGWRKASWQAAPTPGPRGERGAPGSAGLTGPAANVTIQGLEGQVGELLTKVANLEAVLKGVTNQQLLGVLDLAPLVQTLCARTTVLTDRFNLLEGVLGGLSLNPVLTTLGGLLNIPALPGALSAFNCQSTP